MSGHHHASDKSSAFKGLIIGAIALFAILYGIVVLTNNHYAGEKPAAAAGAAK